MVERPTGAFSFGAGFSSQDSFVLSASLNNSNAFGRGYSANFTAEYGGRTSRFFLSLNDPYFLNSTYSLGATFFVTTVRFEDFEQDQQGIDLTLGHSLREDNTARAFLHYGFSQRRIKQSSNVNASAPLFREVLQKNESTSLIGLSFRSDTRDDRFAPTSGTNYSGTLEYAGLGGFANFLRAETRFAYYQKAPSWMIKNSAFVASTRMGYALPFNSVSDYDLDLGRITACDNPNNCSDIARLALPVSSRDVAVAATRHEDRGHLPDDEEQGLVFRRRRDIVKSPGVVANQPADPQRLLDHRDAREARSRPTRS